MALTKCNNCGGMVSDKAKACPHCGTPVVANNRSQDIKAPTQGSNEYYNESKRKSNTGLIVAFVLGLLALLGVGGWLWYDNQQKLIALEQLQEKARQDSIAHASIPLNKEVAVVNAASAKHPVTSSSGVNMSLWGSIGEAHCKDFIMEGKTGYYQFEGKDNAKRTLKLKSYDKTDGRCVLDAYLRGKYIGKFDGQYEIITGEHAANIYKGKFISVRGVILDFYLYVD